MEKITSFTINHLKLLPGVYVSRRDLAGDFPITTFDIRMTRPNREPVMNTAEVHTIEHLGATFLRNHRLFKDKVLYFGPMGCRTGLRETTNPPILFPCFRKCSSLFGIMKERSPAPLRVTAATIST